MSDSSSSPTKTKWQTKAEKYLKCIEDVRNEYGADEEEKEERISFDFVQKLLRRCVSLHELEKVINEAEMYDIYDKNEVYDRLVDFHIKTLNAVKSVKKWFPVKDQGPAKKLKHSAVHILAQGVKFREVEELLVHIDVHLRVEELKTQQLTVSTLNSLLIEVDKCPGVVDYDVIESLKRKKNQIEYANEKLSKLPKIEYLRDIDETQLKGLIQDIKHHKSEVKKVTELESLVKIAESLNKLYSFMISEEMIHQTPDCILNQLNAKLDQMINHLKSNKESFFNNFDEYSEACCREVSQMLPLHVKECDLNDDQTLFSFCSKLQGFLWKSNATRILTKNDENEKNLETCIKEAPETNSMEYALIRERLHCIRTAKQTEKRIKEKINHFWSLSIEGLIQQRQDVKEFVKESKSFFNDKTVEKQIENLEETLNLFNQDSIKSEDLNKLTREFEIYNKGYPLLDEVKSHNTAVDLAKMYKEKVDYTWKRNEKARETLKEKKSLRDVQMIPRIECKKAQEFLKGFKKVDTRLIHEFVEPTEKLEKAIDNLNLLSTKCSEFENQYSRGTLLNLECTKGVIQAAFEKYDRLLEEYLNLEIKENSLEQFLDQNELFLKAQALLKNISFPELRRDISSWENIIQKLKKYSQLSRDILKNMELKMSMAEKLLMEAHKMRTFETQTPNGGSEAQAKQAKMLTVEQLKDIMRTYELGESEIELQDTMNYLEKIINCYNEYKLAVQKSSSLRSLEELKVSIQKLPIFVEDSLYLQLEEKMREPTLLKNTLLDFLQQIKEYPWKLPNELPTWKTRFELTPVKVEEWEDFLQAYKDEQQFEANLVALLRESKDINEVREIKSKYAQHRYVINPSIDCKLLAVEIGSIQGVYERRLFGEEKPGKLFEMSELLEISEKTKQMTSCLGSDDHEIRKRFSFIQKLIEDINKFIEDRINGSGTLEELNWNIERNPFGDMVDLSAVLDAQKAKLSAEAMKYGPGSVKIRQNFINSVKTNLEKNMVFSLAGIDLTQAAKNIEKAIFERCLNRAKSYEDYAGKVLKIIQRLFGFSAISNYLKDKNFDLNLIEKLFPKTKAEFQTLEDNILVSNKKKDSNDSNFIGKDSTAFNYFKIFQGTLFFGLRDKKTQKKVEGVELFSCCTLPIIRQFSIIPNKLLLSMTISIEEFHKYLIKALSSENYVILPCWARFPQDSATQARSYMEKNQLVASSSYCKTCKIFIIPKNEVRPEWLKNMTFYLAREDNEPIDFVCFCFFKNNVTNEYSAPIAPIPQPFKENCTFHQLYSLLNNVLERNIDPNHLLQKPKPIPQEIVDDNYENSITCDENELIVNDYDEFFYSEDDMEDNDLVLHEPMDENVWISQSNDWSPKHRRAEKKNKLLKALQFKPHDLMGPQLGARNDFDSFAAQLESQAFPNELQRLDRSLAKRPPHLPPRNLDLHGRKNDQQIIELQGMPQYLNAGYGNQQPQASLPRMMDYQAGKNYHRDMQPHPLAAQKSGKHLSLNTGKIHPQANPYVRSGLPPGAQYAYPQNQAKEQPLHPGGYYGQKSQLRQHHGEDLSGRHQLQQPYATHNYPGQHARYENTQIRVSNNYTNNYHYDQYEPNPKPQTPNQLPQRYRGTPE